MTTKRAVFIGSPLALVLILAGLWYTLAGASSPDAATPSVAATAAQKQAFVSLVQSYRRTFFDGWLTGDLSKFPAVFYNDPASPPDARLQSLVDKHRAAIDGVLANSPAGPVGATTGELSARMADVMWRRESASEWQSAKATAAAQGRAPTLKDMPDGQPPVMPVQASDWVEKTIFVKDAEIQSTDHASIVYVLDSPDSTLLFHMNLINVNDHWYITKDWTTGNP